MSTSETYNSTRRYLKGSGMSSKEVGNIWKLFKNNQIKYSDIILTSKWIKNKEYNPKRWVDSIFMFSLNEMYYNSSSSAITKMLILDFGADPSNFENMLVWVASKKNHSDLIKIALKDRRVDPAVKYNMGLRLAAENGFEEIVRMFLEDSRIDPNNFAFRHPIIDAFRFKHLGAVKIFLDDGRIGLDQLNRCLISAARIGDIDSVKKLLLNKKLDPTTGDHGALLVSKMKGCDKIFKAIISDHRYTPFRYNISEIIEKKIKDLSTY